MLSSLSVSLPARLHTAIAAPRRLHRKRLATANQRPAADVNAPRSGQSRCLGNLKGAAGPRPPPLLLEGPSPLLSRSVPFLLFCLTSSLICTLSPRLPFVSPPLSSLGLSSSVHLPPLTCSSLDASGPLYSSALRSFSERLSGAPLSSSSSLFSSHPHSYLPRRLGLFSLPSTPFPHPGQPT